MIAGYIGDLKGCTPFQFWTPHGAHHLAYANELAGRQIIVSVRVFDLYAAVVPVTKQPSRYLQAPLDPKLRFLAIDSTTGRIWNAPFRDEQHRLALAMTAARHTPPFPDPL
jgi:hypothetical protein